MATFKTKSDYYKFTKYFVPSQPNPKEKLGHGKRGDCVIRAFAHVFNITWLEAFDILCENARLTYTTPNDVKNNVSDYMERNGYQKETYKAEKGKKRLTCEEFAKTHPTGIYFIKVANHATACIDGKLYDSWNTSNEIVYTTYKIK